MDFVETAMCLSSTLRLEDGYPEAWEAPIKRFFESPEGKNLVGFLRGRIKEGVRIFPVDPFRALRLVAPKDVRVVILGQDPYHEVGQATGLSFAVPSTLKKLPPSLKNIFKEIARETGRSLRINGDLSDWAEQGVLLLNSSLTVEEGRAASHAKLGWEALTDAILIHLLKVKRPRVFLLWGAHAQAKEQLIQENSLGETLILKANHPSPLSALRGPAPFIGCGHFLEVNRFLSKHGEEEILWAKSDGELPF